MDLILKYFETIKWEDIIFSGLRILLILVIVWILIGVVGRLLKRLEKNLIAKGHAEGEVPTEAAKRAETLVRLLRQGVVIVMWVMAILLILRQIDRKSVV